VTLPRHACVYGAVDRKGLAQLTENDFIQPFCAAILAGLIGALAVRYDLSSSLRLVAVCPCMVLVPGPHFLYGALDLIGGRIHLGAARLLYAILIVVAISTGLLLGLALLGGSLPVDPPGRSVPLWEDVIAAGIAVACYSVFFSTPLSMLTWPVAVGMLAHCTAMGCARRFWFWCRSRRIGRMHRRWPDPYSSFAAHAHAVCGDRLRICRVDDARRLPVQDDEWPRPDHRWYRNVVGLDCGNHIRRHDRTDHRFSNELGPHHSEVDYRLRRQPLDLD
jgi:uncharacterized membrane protein YjjB (DUF3815 family)